MAGVSDQEMRAILARVRGRFGDSESDPKSDSGTDSARDTVRTRAIGAGATAEGVFESVEAAVAAADVAYESYRDLGLESRYGVVASIRAAMRRDGEELGRVAAEETGLGRAEDKRVKNLLVTNKTPGPEDLEPQAKTGDGGMTVTEYAPFGVIGAITPTTNPVATIINNTIAAVSAGNSVVFNVHPNAKSVSIETIRRINQAVVEAEGPPNLATCVAEPTIGSAQELMHHRAVRLLVVTGGPAVVREAMKSDKRAICAGPGNPPVLVDETADIDLAAREIVRGASFDNNMVCTDEKEVLVVNTKGDELVRALDRAGAVVLKEYELKKLERVIFERLGEPGKPGVINRRWIGQNAGKILAEIGAPVAGDPRLIVAEVPQEHSLIWTEQMMPVMPVARVRNTDEGIDLAVRAEHGFRHTASIFSNDVATITRMARAMRVSIFVANAANVAGLGEGGEDFTSFSIATPTGEGLTRPRTFSRIRRLTVVGSLRIV